MNILRLTFLFYIIFLFLILIANNFSIGDLNTHFYFYFIQLVILLEVVVYILKRLKRVVNITPAYLILLIYTVINSLTLAFYPQLRDMIFNRFGHLISGIIYAIIASEVIQAGCDKTRLTFSKAFYLLFVFSLASTAGVLNEIIELGLDVATGSHRIGPGFDTAIDLLMNTYGIVIILIMNSWKRRNPLTPPGA